MTFEPKRNPSIGKKLLSRKKSLILLKLTFLYIEMIPLACSANLHRNYEKCKRDIETQKTLSTRTVESYLIAFLIIYQNN